MKSVARCTIAALSALVIALSSAWTAAPAQAASGTHTWLVNATSAAATAQASAAATKAGGTVVQSWPQIGVVVVRTTRSDFARRLTALHSPAVLSFADSHGGQHVTDRLATSTVRTQTVSRSGSSAPVSGTDPLQSKQAYLGAIKAASAQKITGGSGAVVVGVLDTGVNDRHADLRTNFSAADSVDCTAGGRPNTAANAWRGSDSHGTHVAGTIAAARNGVGVTGVAPRVKVASIKVVDAEGATYPEYLVCAYLWAAQRNIAVTNASINLFDFWCGSLDLNKAALLGVQRAIGYASKRGVAHVQSAGNSGDDDSWQLGGSCFDPLAARSDVLQVGSVTAKSKLSWFSSRGKNVVDIVALGENVYSDSISGYESRTGTSQAAPQVSGALALMKSKRPSATPAQLIATVKATASGIAPKTAGSACRGTAKANTCTGAGRLDVLAAVRAA